MRRFDVPDVSFELGKLQVNIFDDNELKLVVEPLHRQTQDNEICLFGDFAVNLPSGKSIFGVNLFEHHVNFGFRVSFV